MYLLLESVRELLGPGRVLGNHLVLDAGDGVYVALAHLRRGSLYVTKGQRVRAGQLLARCGNSGNSTKPDLHLQVMDHADPLFAAGLPLRFAQISVDGQGRQGMPGKRELFEVSP